MLGSSAHENWGSMHVEEHTGSEFSELVFTRYEFGSSEPLKRNRSFYLQISYLQISYLAEGQIASPSRKHEGDAIFTFGESALNTRLLNTRFMLRWNRSTISYLAISYLGGRGFVGEGKLDLN